MNVEVFLNNLILKNFKKLFKPKKSVKNVSALISISLSHRQCRGEIETYLQTFEIHVFDLKFMSYRHEF